MQTRMCAQRWFRVEREASSISGKHARDAKHAITPDGYMAAKLPRSDNLTRRLLLHHHQPATASLNSPINYSPGTFLQAATGTAPRSSAPQAHLTTIFRQQRPACHVRLDTTRRRASMEPARPSRAPQGGRMTIATLRHRGSSMRPRLCACNVHAWQTPLCPSTPTAYNFHCASRPFRSLLCPRHVPSLERHAIAGVCDARLARVTW